MIDWACRGDRPWRLAALRRRSRFCPGAYALSRGARGRPTGCCRLSVRLRLSGGRAGGLPPHRLAPAFFDVEFCHTCDYREACGLCRWMAKLSCNLLAVAASRCMRRAAVCRCRRCRPQVERCRGAVAGAQVQAALALTHPGRGAELANGGRVFPGLFGARLAAYRARRQAGRLSGWAFDAAEASPTFAFRSSSQR